jgi:hypothetical protein
MTRQFEAARRADVAAVAEPFADHVVDLEQAAARLEATRRCAASRSTTSRSRRNERGPAIRHVGALDRCLRKVEGRWLIVHQHLSNPFDPTTLKADFNFGNSGSGT